MAQVASGVDDAADDTAATSASVSLVRMRFFATLQLLQR
jgi:hypothetical protein